MMQQVIVLFRLNYMRVLIFPLLFLMFCSSCEKDEKVRPEFTSEVPDEFLTKIVVKYFQNTNTTEVKAGFHGNETADLKLPSNSKISYNGIELSGEFEKKLTIEGNSNAVIEFLDWDQKLYSNSFEVPDTNFFIDLPDTVDSNQDLLIKFGGPPLESDETWSVFLTISSNYNVGDEMTIGGLRTDSTLLINKNNLKPQQSYPVTLLRWKELNEPNLPLGSGRVIYRYEIVKNIYCK